MKLYYSHVLHKCSSTLKYLINVEDIINVEAGKMEKMRIETLQISINFKDSYVLRLS